MAIDTFGELQAEVASWLQRSDLSSRIPTFIELATADFNAVMRVPQMEALASTTFDGEYNALPDNFLGIRHIETAAGDRMTSMTPEEYAVYAASDITPSVPVYTIADMAFRVYPTPTALDVELLYYEMIPVLVNSGDTNWLLEQHPNVYLAGSLVWGFRHLHDQKNAADWEGATQRLIDRVVRSGRRIAEGASTLAVRAA